MIPGNPIWNQRVAGMTGQSKPLYTFEIPDEGLIITSFIPSKEGVVLDTNNLISQTLWYQAALRAQSLLSVPLSPVSGFVLQSDDGVATVVVPEAQVTRYNYGPTITGASGYFSWNGIEYPVGMMDVSSAISIDLVMLSTLVDSGGYTPYANVDYSVDGIPAELTTWFSALHDNTAGWTNRTDTLRLWPGNTDVGLVMPNVNKVQVKVSQSGTTVGSSPNGNVFLIQPTLLVGFV